MNKSMKLKVVGVIFLALGIVGLQLNPNRQEENLKIARTATNAYEAAKAISENNQKEIFIVEDVRIRYKKWYDFEIPYF